MTSNHQQHQEQQVSAEGQHAPSTGQPGVDLDGRSHRPSDHGNEFWSSGCLAAICIAERERLHPHYHCSCVESLQQQLAAAQAELSEWKARAIKAGNDRYTISSERDQLRAQCEALSAALKNYGNHRRFSCTWYGQRVGDPPVCSCGFLAALDAASAGQKV